MSIDTKQDIFQALISNHELQRDLCKKIDDFVKNDDLKNAKKNLGQRFATASWFALSSGTRRI